MRQLMSKTSKDSEDRNVLEFDLGVRIYPPSRAGGYWRIRWEERRQPKGTSAKDQPAAIKKAQDIVERLRRSVPTNAAAPRASTWWPTTSIRPGGRRGWRSGR
jgi:hypothetical protein